MISGSRAPSVGLKFPMAVLKAGLSLEMRKKKNKKEKKTHCTNMSEQNQMGVYELWIAGEVRSQSFAIFPPCSFFYE